MKRKFTARIVAVLSAMVMAASMMMTSASAAANNAGTGTVGTNSSVVFEDDVEIIKGYWTVKKEPSGATTHYIVDKASDETLISKYSHDKTYIKINCTSYSSNVSSSTGPAYAHYAVYKRTSTTGSKMSTGVTGDYYAESKRTEYFNTAIDNKKYNILVEITLNRYSNINYCNISGNYNIH